MLFFAHKSRQPRLYSLHMMPPNLFPRKQWIVIWLICLCLFIVNLNNLLFLQYSYGYVDSLGQLERMKLESISKGSLNHNNLVIEKQIKTNAIKTMLPPEFPKKGTNSKAAVYANFEKNMSIQDKDVVLVDVDDPDDVDDPEDPEHSEETEHSKETMDYDIPDKNDPDKVRHLTRKQVIKIIKGIYEGDFIDREYLVYLLQEGKKMLGSLEKLYDVPIPVMFGEDSDDSGTKVTIVGDTHGQFDILLHIFQANGWPSPQHTYIFNGDFMDKGKNSTENLVTLIAFKLYCPECLHITRGNHEIRSNLDLQVKGEVIERFDDEVYEDILDVIQEIPVAIVLGEKIFVIHAGINSPDLTYEDMKNITSKIEPREGSLLDDLLWADPGDEDGMEDDPGRGLLFGPDVSKSFLERNGLDLMVRGHETVAGGYRIDHDGKVLTIWSAPHEQGVFGKGSYLNIDANLDWKIKHFDIHPVVPEISWSII